MKDSAKLYAGQIKALILKHPELFGDLGKTTIIFEKALPTHSVIADCLIFSSIQGVIGIEIKTDHDNTRRLNNQLKAYEEICDRVYVLCHDNKVAEVIKVLKRYHHDSVGLMSYSTYQGEQLTGIIRDVQICPTFDPANILRVLWKHELVAVANSLTSSGTLDFDLVQRKLNLDAATRSYGRISSGTINPISQSMPKEQIVQYIVGILGLLGAHQLIVDMFINHTKHPDKVLHYYHFKPTPEVHYHLYT